jgi:Toprim domain
MIAAFGPAHELDTGIIGIGEQNITGVHLTRLLPDGSGKAVFEDADEVTKIMIGYSAGSPIVLAPPNDALGVVIAEGIEDALSAHEATGLGAWAAGSASRMPALAGILPDFIEVVTVLVDDDQDGRRHAAELGRRLRARGTETRLIVPGATRCAA